jgi:NADPH:quinone reductase-like Zn-dependent oxidoreductase
VLPLANMTVVITSGSGGTGYLAIQMARALGATNVITAATGVKPTAWMKALGADMVVDYMKHEIFDVLDDSSVDAVFDNFGANGTADKAMAKLRVGGTYLLLPHGNGQGTLSKHPKKGVNQINFGNVDNTQYHTLDMLGNMFDSGKIKINAPDSLPGIQHIYGYDEAASAYGAVASGTVLGKLAVAPPPY